MGKQKTTTLEIAKKTNKKKRTETNERKWKHWKDWNDREKKTGFKKVTKRRYFLKKLKR